MNKEHEDRDISLVNLVVKSEMAMACMRDRKLRKK